MSITFIPSNVGNYQKGRTSSIKYIVIHYTANKGDTAANNCKYFQSGGRAASAHYFIDKKEVCQSVADNDTAWSVGGTYGGTVITNSNSLSIELCDFQTENLDVLKVAIPFIQSKMAEYKVPLERVVRHWDVGSKANGGKVQKQCPLPYVGVSNHKWEGFKNLLVNSSFDLNKEEKEEDEMIIYESIEQVPEWGRYVAELDIRKGYLSFPIEYSLLRARIANYRQLRDLGLVDKETLEPILH